MKNKKTIYKLIVIAFIVLVAEFVLSLFLGKYPLKLKELLAGDIMSLKVFKVLRLPRTMMAAVGGFCLGVAGMVYQLVFKNPLASPDIIGVSSGASAGAAFAILFLPSAASYVTAGAFVGSLIALLCTLALAGVVRNKSHGSIVLAGIAVHSLAQTALMMLKLTADPEKQLASIEYWIMGSLNAITLYKLPVAFIISLISVFILFLLHRQVIMLTADEEEATVLGVPVVLMRLVVLVFATLTVAAIVSVTGLISFIGLLAPHIALMLCKNNQKSTLLLSGLVGGGLLLLADMLARTVAEVELPVSIFTSLLGAPFLLYLLMKRGAVNG